MINLLKKKWWKVIGVILLTGALLSGLLIPLAPGISTVTPEVAQSGETVRLNIIGYNSHFKTGEESLELVLKNETLTLCGEFITVSAENNLEVDFKLPGGGAFTNKFTGFNLFINNSIDGSSYRPGALRVKKGTDQGISIDNCEIGFTPSGTAFLSFPYREMLYETIRNLFFHVPMWFAMTLILLFSFIASIIYLNKLDDKWDLITKEAAVMGLVFGLLGAVTGATWANFTWGAPWPNDPRTNSAAAGILIYLAYFVLRGSFNNDLVRAKVSSVYNIFAFVLFIVFIFVLPRLTEDGLHPGVSGNPAFSKYDLDNTMRPVFYSSILGFTIIGLWIISLRVRYFLLKEKLYENQ